MRNEISDHDGNRLFFDGTWVRLQLKNETRIRTLGEVRGNTFFALRPLTNHEMHNREEYGFNYHLIKYGLFRNIVVRTVVGREYKTTRLWVLKHGKVHRPGGKRYELQVFLHLSEFKGFVEPPPDAAPKGCGREKSVQGTLFGTTV